eukprot:CAMPEP_0203747238 /NCGR_PEP_ID=MMETSP0098-20131031/2444_1 /ASSEMBLY_ACC=CAM_ASM_000208 /TAXON_ID=96639 /ORGANISM=" , Strain NY0313808BC1" /LENGTH=1738 /DNA_ID=CAMNT_0050635603 /DNA_START=601 /DNA_END=5817 /DNA_ORIENTATION=+
MKSDVDRNGTSAPSSEAARSTVGGTASSGEKKSTWHDDPQADVEPRRVVIQQIVALLESCRPEAFANRQEKLVDLARRLEVALYKQSKTKEEYMDKNTLRHRVRELAKASTAQQKKKEDPVASSSQQNSSGKAVSQEQVQRNIETNKHPSSANTKKVSTSQNRHGTGQLTEQEQRQQVLKQRQQRLLLLRHASRCPSTEGTCKITAHCAPMKKLWKHIAKCKDERCSVPHCVSSRYVLSHYHRCKKDDCPVCKPVRIISQNQRHQQLQAAGVRGSSMRQQMSRSAMARQHQLLANQQAIDPKRARYCVSGTGPSLPFNMNKDTVQTHVSSLRIERLQNAVTPLLRKLIENKNNKGVFNEPVDAVALNIPRYHQVIKEPMDLGTVRMRLDDRYYQTLDQFKDDVILVFENAIKFNPPENGYHVRAQSLLKVCEAEFPRIKTKLERDGRKRGENCQLCFQQQCEVCPLCERGCIPFEPKVLFCSGACALRIARNANYFTGVGNNYCWCSDCFDKCKSDHLVVNNQQFYKRDLVKKKNNELYGEPWVSCDVCERWCHQVCALFNSRKNNPNSDQKYVCPNCLVKENDLGERERASDTARNKRGAVAPKREVPEPGTGAIPAPLNSGNGDVSTKGKYRHLVLPAGRHVPGAADLEHTRLGIFLEMWIRDRIRKYQQREKENPSPLTGDLGPDPSKLHVRVLSSFDENCKVKPFVKKLLPEYPDKFGFRSRCIFLFQELDGVDVLFFAMFVQEYGSECPEPNKRKLYIAYLDSVYYFRPRKLRTMVYHELLLSYLEYSRRNGFTSAYIWACPPPNKRDDYIIHCHPEDQRVQTADRLRKWYHEMIRRGSSEHIFLGSCALFEEHFEATARPNNNKKKSKKKSSKKTKNDKKGRKGRKGTVTLTGSNTRSSTLANAGATPVAPDDENDERENLNNFLPDLSDVAGDDGDDGEEETAEGNASEPAAVESSPAEGGTASSDSKATALATGINFVTPANGVLSGDDRMLKEDVERRKLEKLAVNGRLPYFEGDYWPQEAEELAKEREAKKKKDMKGLKNGRRKRRRNGEAVLDDDLSAPEGGSLPAAAAPVETKAPEQKDGAGGSLDLTNEEAKEARKQLMQRLSEQLDAMKDDFLVVKMAHECSRCAKYLLRGRWECRHPTCREDSGFNKSCPFALCNDCYILECARPVEQQHGGGCVAPGASGEPKEKKEEDDKEKGKDQEIINVNAKEEDLKKKEEEDSKKKTGDGAEEGKNKKDVKQESEQDPKKRHADSSLDKDQDPKRPKPDVQVKGEPGNETSTKVEKMEVDEGSGEKAGSEDDKKDAASSKPEKTVSVEKTDASKTSGVSSSSSTSGLKSDGSSNQSGAVKQETKKPPTEEEIRKKREEERAALIVKIKEWKKQSIECTRLVAKEGNSHILFYVDENLPIHTPTYDRNMKNHLLETRHAFLSLCTGNRYQFDQLRRAKHSTMMVLYHLHNLDAPAHLYTCFECHTDILSGNRYHCDICNSGDYDLCRSCKEMKPHGHTLTPFVVTRGVNAETSEAQRMQRVTEMRRARKHSLALFLQALVHSSTCSDPTCKEAPCKKMKDLLKHRMNCEVRVRGGCEICRRVLCLVQMHARQCKAKDCRVPHCEDLKAHIQNQQAQVIRRQAQLQEQKRALEMKQHGLVQRQGGVRPNLASARGNGRGIARPVRGRPRLSSNSGTHSSSGEPASQPFQATVVEGSGGTRLKIRPTATRGRGGLSRGRGK